MHVSVIGLGSLVADQICAYAEYKVFSSLAPLYRHVDEVRVIVTATGVRDDAARCEVVVKLGQERLRTRTRRSQPVAAIDAAAAGIRRAAARRLGHVLQRSAE